MLALAKCNTLAAFGAGAANLGTVDQAARWSGRHKAAALQHIKRIGLLFITAGALASCANNSLQGVGLDFPEHHWPNEVAGIHDGLMWRARPQWKAKKISRQEPRSAQIAIKQHHRTVGHKNDAIGTGALPRSADPDPHGVHGPINSDSHRIHFNRVGTRVCRITDHGQPRRLGTSPARSARIQKCNYGFYVHVRYSDAI